MSYSLYINENSIGSDVMRSLTFQRQIVLGIVLIIVGNLLAFTFHNGIFSNIMWILYGLLFILNPVYPEQSDSKKGKKVQESQELFVLQWDYSQGLLYRIIVYISFIL